VFKHKHKRFAIVQPNDEDKVMTARGDLKTWTDLAFLGLTERWTWFILLDVGIVHGGSVFP
jgi:hypothetical protein